MKKFILFYVAFFIIFTASVFADEEATISGKASFNVKSVDGERKSSKFLEYRDLPDGLSGSFELLFKKSDKYFMEFKGYNISQDDQYVGVSGGRYGYFKFDLNYDKIPHRFAFDARTLYSGIGTGDLIYSDSMQSDLQNNATSLTDLALRLSDYFAASYPFDVEFIRENTNLDIDVMAFDPLNFKFSIGKEDRKGIRPYFGSFGFYNALELVEPIEYDTTNASLTMEFAKRPFYVNAGLHVSCFQNNIDTLIWDNPFRVDDASRAPFPSSYLNPYQLGPALINEASTTGLIDLPPDNEYQNFFITGTFELPMKGRILAKLAWGSLEQDDALYPYTSNTAIMGEQDLNGDGTLEFFDAWDVANLPLRKADAEVDTTLYTLLFTIKPLNFMDIKARYRSYEYDNKGSVIHFPGYVRTDANWEDVEIATEPSSWEKTTYGIDFGFDLFKRSNLTVGYAQENIERIRREVADSDEDIFKVSFDTSPVSWMDLRFSYEMSERDGDYDYTVPFHLLMEQGENPPQLPWLRKYDEANRDRDRAQLLLTFYPIDDLILSGSFIHGKDDFKDSLFGLLEDKHRVYTFDIDYALKEAISLYAFYSLEKYENLEKARQWDPDDLGDPYIADTTPVSFCNWYGEAEDEIHTLGAGLRAATEDKKYGLNFWYSMSKAEGEILFSSPLGDSTNDINEFVPIAFEEVDNTKLQTFSVSLKRHLTSSLALAIGFLREKWEVEDFNYIGFDFIPLTTTGAYNATFLMGTLEPEYDVNIGYVKLYFKF